MDQIGQFVKNFNEAAILLTLKGKIISCNQYFCNLLQTSQGKLSSLTLQEVCKLYSIDNFLLSSLLSGISQKIIFEHSNKESKTIQWQATKLTDEKDSRILLIGINISPIMHALTQTQKIQNSIIDLIPDHYIFWKDKNLNYLGCNQALVQSLGFNSSKDVIGKSDYDLPTIKEQSAAYRADDKEILETAIPKLGIEESQKLSNGTEKILLTSKVPLFDDEGNVNGVLAIYSDITHRKKMEEDLHRAKIAAEAANHAKSEFLANISHDVRTPLTGIIFFSRYLEEQDEISEAKRKELAGVTYRASMQLLNLLNGVLEVVSADSATDHSLNLQSFNLKEMIDGLIQLEKPAVKSHRLELKKSIDKNIPEFIISDKMKLHRILLNLIGNSIKFTEKGYIKISAKLQSNDQNIATVVFSVEDTGIGIPDDAQPQIFERFYKVNASYKGKYKGNGIGLNIVQTYLRLLNGKIDFHSTFGKGTTFLVTLTFPIGEKPQNDAEESPYNEMLK